MGIPKVLGCYQEFFKKYYKLNCHIQNRVQLKNFITAINNFLLKNIQ